MGLIMKDQHKLIKGYRDLSQAEIDAMNAVKAEGARLGILIEELRDNPELDQRWVDIAETHLQQGCMAAVRSIAQPTTF
jgi:molybdate-binding protein